MSNREPISHEVRMANAAKASATKLAKRITKICEKCGKEWKEKPSHAWRRFCSRECSGSSLRHPTRKSCVQCGTVFDTNWRTRKRITCSDVCAHKQQGKTMAQLGHSPIKFRTHTNWILAVKSEKNRQRAVLSSTGRVHEAPKSKRHSPNHVRAVEGFVRSPSNIIFHVANITGFVYNNERLFNAEDVIWKAHKRYSTSLSCKASVGISVIMRGARMVWKGWTVVSNREGRERMDLIGRNFQPEENQRP